MMDSIIMKNSNITKNSNIMKTSTPIYIQGTPIYIKETHIYIRGTLIYIRGIVISKQNDSRSDVPASHLKFSIRIPTVKLKISGKNRIQKFCYIQASPQPWKKCENVFSIFHIFFMVVDLLSPNRCHW